MTLPCAGAGGEGDSITWGLAAVYAVAALMLFGLAWSHRQEKKFYAGLNLVRSAKYHGRTATLQILSGIVASAIAVAFLAAAMIGK